MTQHSRILQNNDFLRLWFGETVSLFGSQITQFALPALAVLVLSASPFEMGLLAAAGSMPILLLSLPAGAWIDRRLRRPILISTNLGRALLLSLIPLSVLFGSLSMPLLYVIAVLVGSLSVLFEIAYQSYLPSLVEQEQLAEGNGKLEISRSVAQVAGPALGGLLVTLLTAPVTIIADAFSFVVSAICLASIRKPELLPEANRPHRTFRGDILEGLRFIAQHTLLRTVVVATGLINIASGAIFAQQILYMTDVLALSPALVGMILSIGGPSAMLGALLVNRVVRRYGIGRTIVCGSLLFCSGDFCMALAGGPPALRIALLALAQLCIGVGSPIYNVTVITFRQRLAPSHLIGRVTASARFVTIGTLPIGAFLGGLLAQVAGLQPTLLVASCWVLCTIIWLAWSPAGVIIEPPRQEESNPTV
ncbi:MAG TPA: MFS transporter [Herpetosiphonaceae bacterium]